MGSRRAVITALGVVTPIGGDVTSYWQALVAGVSGVKPLTLCDPSSLPSRIAGEIVGFDAKKLIPAAMKDARKSLNKMSRTIQLGVVAAHQAMTDGGPAKGQIDPFRFGIEFGCVMVATETEDLSKGGQMCGDPAASKVDLDRWGREGLKQVPPLWMLKYLPNMPACHVSVNYDAQGPNNTITATDVAGPLALGEAFRLLGRNAADFFLVGACDSRLNPVSFTRFNKFAPLCVSRNSDPTHAVRPFDAAHDGLVVGEGAAVLGLEDIDFARNRGAKVYAELVGFASGFDRGKTGAIFAGVIRNALKEAGIGPADVDHVNAGSGGVPDLDAWEARAIHTVFGTDVPVFAPKGHLANSLAASGLVELAASVLAFQHGELPGTLNHDRPAADCPVRVHTGAPRKVTKPYAVKLSYTDIGQCTAVVVKGI